jgi:D-beta-D-heptose 7-phosphate kinase/D-beta-D-heptose 1-phosphate adenosyltransferase
VRDAATIAMEAAFIAIQKEHTAICYAQELLTRFQLSSKVFQRNLSALCNVYRSQGKRIVFTNGCFDVLHSGHVSYLKGAKEKGDILIVGVNKDDSVTRLKGTGRPINSLEHRMAVLSELNCVDQVIPFGENENDTPIDLIKKIKPDVFVKGADYEKKFMPELNVLKEIGAEIVLIPLIDNQSTTKIIARIRLSVNKEKLPLSS